MKADKHHEPVGREESGGRGRGRSYSPVCAQLPVPTSTLKSRRYSAGPPRGSGQLTERLEVDSKEKT